jgi:putative tricarboxylic transport membrane protein
MAFHNRDKKDFNAGIMFILIGGFFAIFATNYPMGSAIRMGPAYFPTILGGLLGAMGLIVFLRSFFLRGGEAPSKTHWRQLLWIAGAVFVFAVLLDRVGMVISSFGLMMIAAYGGWDFRWKEQLINAVCMTAATVAIFDYGLGLPFRLFPWSF